MSSLHSLVKALSRLPGIGEKSATRLALFILRDATGLSEELVRSLNWVREKVQFCKTCQNLTEQEQCALCQDPNRNPRQICVVQEPVDLVAMERTGDYRGLYHILHGALSPLDGVGPEDIRLQNLLHRLQKQPIEEIILATNPNPEGEATALYLKKILSSSPHIKLTRIASGVPVGGILEYVDPKTLSKSLLHRRDY